VKQKKTSSRKIDISLIIHSKSLEEQNKIEQYRKVIGKLANYFEKILKILFQKSQIDHSADPNHHYKIIREQIMKIQISNTDM
jgi:hypothetical protein